MSTVLIIDDEHEICDIVQDVFETESACTILKADNGPAGLELIKKHSPDVIILDIKLQVNMDGVEVLRQIRQLGVHTKIVVITGFVEASTEREIRDLGVDAYLEKPFTPPQILDTVGVLLKRKRHESR